MLGALVAAPNAPFCEDSTHRPHLAVVNFLPSGADSAPRAFEVNFAHFSRFSNHAPPGARFSEATSMNNARLLWSMCRR